MNKEEKTGMYTSNEIFEHLCENSNIGMLGRSMCDAVMSKIDNLQSQLDTANKKLEDIKSYINYLVIINPNIGRFNKTIWGEEMLEIIGGNNE